MASSVMEDCHVIVVLLRPPCDEVAASDVEKIFVCDYAPSGKQVMCMAIIFSTIDLF